jgi:hypothetical protein
MGSYNPRVSGSESTLTAVSIDRVEGIVPCRLFFATFFNGTAGVLYLQVFDSATTIPNGQQCVMSVAIPAGSTGGLDYATGKPIKTGLSVWLSSTPMLKTGIGFGQNTILDVGYRIS